ncbi:HlyD family efflux transporter periplasmic adaptor subunit [Halopseudomonas nanhaiensis]|uniref:efflux RND transporter periplasmic adaptor subunit n=1 Tax=Halopseudomonas nanhaiensis TaxID=2830842 RepID=UPI001CBB28EF|nr:HlyD family efflux transporter periplasmic adaptor subunit [Halopseudomonas nanhaiensis]UAW99051.1 HlyD family efflux transporter periplasmic adaptor subunit [Halopseudomonas nanhaiensis]
MGVVVVLALVWAASWLWTQQVGAPSGEAEQAEGAPEPVIRESAVEPGQQVLVVQGEWRSPATEPVRTKLGGEMIWAVEDGDIVEAGALLGRIVSGPLQAQLGQAQARLNVAKHQARALRQLVAGGYEPQERLDAAEAELEEAQAAFAAAEQSSEATRIRAPLSGRVRIRQALPEQLPEGEEVAQVVDQDPLLIKVRVPEDHAARLRVGAVARVDLPGAGTVEGRVMSLGKRGEQGAAIAAEIALPNPDHVAPDASPVEVRLPL